MTALVAALDEGFIRAVSEPTPDPRPFYDRLRGDAPVYRTPLGFWYVTRYDLAMTIIRNPRDWPANPIALGKRAFHDARSAGSFALETFRASLMFTDDPKHKLLRRLVGELFTPAGVRTLRGKVEGIVTSQLDDLTGRSSFDLKHDFAERLPTTVILGLLGIDTAEASRFIALSDSIAAILEPRASRETIEAGDAIWRTAAGRVLLLAEQRRARPSDDLLTKLVTAEVDGQRLSDDDLVGMVLSLAVAGHETTANMLVNGMYHLVIRPESMALLRADRSLMGSAIEEFLRYEPPPRNSVARYPMRDMELGGRRIAAGDTVYVGYQAANHDPAEFPSPHQLDLRRSPNRHLGLGIGIHHCLGASLARLELDLALNQLLDRYPRIELGAPDVSWKPGFVVRALTALPLSVGSSARAIAGA
ncbi:MAG TPA: cytochrome P450 [Pseudonocardia sp.]